MRDQEKTKEQLISELVTLRRQVAELKAAEGDHRQVEALHRSEQSLEVELDAARRLQQVSTHLIQADQNGTLYEQILDAAMAIAHADFASIQMFHPEKGPKGELQLLGYRGFNGEAAKSWEWVRPASRSTCGMVLHTRQRAAVSDIEKSDVMAGSDDRKTYLQAGIRAVQSTPLLSRSGTLLGVFSTHWCEPHELTESEERSLDILARLAADLLDRKQAEEALKVEYAKLKATLEALPVAVWVSDTDGRILEANEQAKIIWGGDSPGPSQSIADYAEFEGWHPDTGERLRAEDWAMSRALAKGEVVIGEEVRIRRFDGSWGTILNNAAPIRNVEGRIIGGVTVEQDITERKQMEETLRKSELRFRLLSGIAGQLLASDDPQRIVDELCRKVMEYLDCQCFFNFLVNEGTDRLSLNAFAGISEEEARKIEWLDFGTAVCGCAAQEGRRIIAEDILHTPDMRTELIKSYGIQAYGCHPLMARGKVIGTLSFGTRSRTHFSSEDVALMKIVADQVAVAMERMQLVEELRESRDELELRVQKRTAELETAMKKLQESNQALQDFASMASHDLQEPLRKVRVFGKILSEKYDAVRQDEGKGYLDRMMSAADRMDTLLTSLLAYSRVTTRAEPFEEVRLRDLIREVAVDLEVRLHQTGGRVEPGELPTVYADPTQMRQLFQNLIANALKFHKEDEKPLVKVYAHGNSDHYEILVEDNGIGFEEEYLDRIFSPFQRLHGRSSRFEGSGMGLAICKKIVERHGGTLTARSTPGQGSTFIVTLPVKQPAPPLS